MKLKTILGALLLITAPLAYACTQGNTQNDKTTNVKTTNDTNANEAMEQSSSPVVEEETPSFMATAEYTKEDSALVVKLLNDAKTERGEEHPMLYFGKKFLGVPYVAHTLENGDTEHLIVNLHELDCTTFVETVTALTLCDKADTRTFTDYCKQLVRIRYRKGVMGDYTSRLHYFTWWGEDNEQLGIVKCIYSVKKPFTAIQKVNINYMSKHPDSYKQLKAHPEFVKTISNYERGSSGKTYYYIPKENVGWKQSSSLKIVETGDILAMLTSKEGLDTSHIGIAVWQNGKLHLLNASYVYKKVVLDTKTFYDYQQVQTSQTGVRVFRVQTLSPALPL